MNGVNRVQIWGHLGHDPELQRTPNGNLFCDLRIATNHSVKHNEEWSSQVTWHRVRVWEQKAERASRLLRKGSPVGIEGYLQTHKWEDDGHTRFRLQVRCREMHIPSPASVNLSNAVPPPLSTVEGESASVSAAVM